MTDRQVPLGATVFYRVTATLLGIVVLALAALLPFSWQQSLFLGVGQGMWLTYLGLIAISMWRNGSRWRDFGVASE
jgi:hypothetical protein